MKNLRISSTTNLHFGVDENISEYIKNEVIFQKEAGFEATDFGLGMIDFFDNNWQAVVEQAILDAESGQVLYSSGGPTTTM